MLKVGFVGVGAIGRAIAKAIDAGIPRIELAGLIGLDLEKAQTFAKSLRRPAPVLLLDQLIEASDLVVEAALHNSAFLLDALV
jgi:aspartate dehydrogenase